MFKGGKWGTICDPLYSRFPWQGMACEEMGYVNASETKFARDTTLTAATGPITKMVPRCFWTPGVTIHDCIQGLIPCGHFDDIYIHCTNQTGPGKPGTFFICHIILIHFLSRKTK